MAKKVLVVLQENSGKVALPDGMPNKLKKMVYKVVDQLAESFEDLKNHLQGSGKYKKVFLLTDDKCTRTELMKVLAVQTVKGNIIDLLVIGHGSTDSISLHGGKHLTGGEDGNLRKMLDDVHTKPKWKTIMGSNAARRFPTFNLRMVYSITCKGSTLNDDWLAIGAKVAIGPKNNDYMPEPMLTFFMHYWLDGKRAKKAAMDAYRNTIPFYWAIYPPKVVTKYRNVTVKYPCPTWNDPLKTCKKRVKVFDHVETRTNKKITDSRPIVSGKGNIRF
jgi:hypothetical protein